MTEPRDYSQWTFENHLDAAVTLAAEADCLAAGNGALSQQVLRREDIRQTAARGLLHARIAELKKPQPIVVAAEASRPARQRADKPAGS